MLEDTDWNKQRAAATGQAITRMHVCCKEVLKEKKRSLFRHCSVLAFFKSSTETCASPPVLLDTGDDDPGDQPAVQDEVLPSIIVIAFNCKFCKLFCKVVSSVNIYFSLSNPNVWNVQILTCVYEKICLV